MLDREIVLAGPDPDNAAHKPAAGIARVECQRTVDQPDRGGNILAEIRQREGGVGEDARVVVRRLERMPSKVAGLAVGRLQLLGPAFSNELDVAVSRPGKRGPVMRINRDRLFEQSQGLENSPFCCWKEDRKR